MDYLSFVIQYFGLLLSLVLILVGWWFGRLGEQRHLGQLSVSEQNFCHISVSSERFVHPDGDGTLVVGSVVIAQDRFKFMMATLLSLFGKNLTVYETMLERGRREALLRLKTKADKMGCRQVFGVRFESSAIDLYCIEVMAYGTAVK